MNAIVNKLLLARDKFMSEMHLKQAGFAYSACGPFTKNKQRIKKLKKQEIKRYIYLNELDKACFQHDMAYGDLNRRTTADKVLRNKAFNIAINVDLLQWFINFLIKKLQVELLKMKLFPIKN